MISPTQSNADQRMHNKMCKLWSNHKQVFLFDIAHDSIAILFDKKKSLARHCLSLSLSLFMFRLKFLFIHARPTIAAKKNSICKRSILFAYMVLFRTFCALFSPLNSIKMKWKEIFKRTECVQKAWHHHLFQNSTGNLFVRHMKRIERGQTKGIERSFTVKIAFDLLISLITLLIGLKMNVCVHSSFDQMFLVLWLATFDT